MSETPPILPRRDYTPEIIREFLSGYIEPGTIPDVREIEVRHLDTGELLSVGYRLKLSRDEAVDVFYTVDMDDTLVRYAKAKDNFHAAVGERYFARMGLDKKDMTRLLLQINKGARLLPASGVHPEIYNPTVEVLVLASLAARIEHDLEGRLRDEIKALLDKYEDSDQELNKKIRETFILPVLSKEATLLLGRVLGTMEKEGKLYFEELDNELHNNQGLLATAVDDDEVNLIADGLGLAAVVREHFMKIYAEFREHMFEPKINQAVVPKTEDGGRFIVATFGEQRFQLKKVERLLARLLELGLRLPDEIIFFEAGRKPPVILHIWERSQNPNLRVVHLDNSGNQCREIEKLNNPMISTRKFEVGADEECSFEELMRRVVSD